MKIAKTETRSYYIRALQCLPSLTPQQSIQARVELLCTAGQSPRGVQFLLNLKEWKAAVKILQSRLNEDIEHCELFNLLLTYALKIKDYSLLPDIWDFMPKSFQILDLLKLIRQ